MERIEIAGSSARLVGLVVLGIAMTAASLFLVVGVDGTVPRIAGMAGTLLFGLASIGWALRLMRGTRPVITLSDEGLWDRRLSARPIPRGAILGLGEYENAGQAFVVVGVSPETEAAIGLTRMARLTRAGNAALGADGLCIGAQGLKIGHDELGELIHRWVTRG